MIVNADTPMKSGSAERHSDFLKSLVEFTKDHRAARWSGTLSEFLENVFPTDAKAITRSGHQYIWDMLRANGFDDVNGRFRCQLF
jgi:serine protein kinase